MKFELDAEQVALYKVWLKEQNELALRKQQDDLAERRKESGYLGEFRDYLIDGGFSYMGAIACDPSFTFTNSSIGQFVSVKHPITGNILDLTGDL